MDNQVDVLTLIHQRREGQALIFVRKLREFVRDVIGNGRSRIVRLLRKGQQHRRIAVDARIDRVAVIAQEHVRHIGQLDITEPVDME